MKDAQAIADKIAGKSITVGVKAGASGKIFGSVTTLQVATVIGEQLGAEVDKRRIIFSEDIKNIGAYKATINLHKEVTAEMEIEIVQD